MFGNTFGRTTATFNGGKKVWHEVKAQYPVGGVLDVSAKSVGDIIPAGSILLLDMANHIAAPVAAFSTTVDYAKDDYVVKDGAIYKAKSTVSKGSWDASKFDAVKGGFGLLQDDVVVDELALSATGAVTVSLVYEGVIYASRTELTAADLALVPKITPIYE